MIRHNYNRGTYMVSTSLGEQTVRSFDTGNLFAAAVKYISSNIILHQFGEMAERSKALASGDLRIYYLLVEQSAWVRIPL